jgi:hypothetical protein
MPTPNEWSDEADDILFDPERAEELVYAGHPGSVEFPRLPDSPSRPVEGDAVDAALFGAAPEAAVDAAPALGEPEVQLLFDGDGEDDGEGAAVSEEDVPTDPTMAPLIVAEPPPLTVDEEDPALVDEDATATVDEEGEGDAPVAISPPRRRRRAIVVAAAALLVIVGGGLGVVALTRSDDPEPAVNTDRDVTTTATPATTSPAPTLPPETAPPPAAPAPSTSAPRPRAPTTTARPAAPAPPATQPAPPPPPPPPQPPPTDPPTTTTDPPLPLP